MAARAVPAGQSWIFPEHRTLAEVRLPPAMLWNVTLPRSLSKSGHHVSPTGWRAPIKSSPPARADEDAEIAAWLATHEVTRCPTKFINPSEHAKPDEREIPALLAQLPRPVTYRVDELRERHRLIALKQRRMRGWKERQHE